MRHTIFTSTRVGYVRNMQSISIIPFASEYSSCCCSSNFFPNPRHSTRQRVPTVKFLVGGLLLTLLLTVSRVPIISSVGPLQHLHTQEAAALSSVPVQEGRIKEGAENVMEFKRTRNPLCRNATPGLAYSGLQRDSYNLLGFHHWLQVASHTPGILELPR